MFRVFGSMKFSRISNSSHRVLIDLLVVACAALAFRLLTLEMDLFERFADYSEFHEDWELDELFVTLMIVGLAFIVFGIRRMQDQRRELALRQAAEQHAQMLALQDPLTGLPNRRRFHDSLAPMIAGGRGPHAVLILDLDGFKEVNDAFGHASGDEALRTMAQRLRTLCDARVMAARLGGDEFAITIRDVAGVTEAEEVAARAIALIEVPIAAAGVEHRLEVSIGIAIVGTDPDPAEEYVRRADVALYRAKEKGGSAFMVYDEKMDTEMTERVLLEKDLRLALTAREIIPHYQPIVNLKSGEVIKLEALARWRHPTRGYIEPAIFIPLAEHRGMIAELTESILRQACADALSWPLSVIVSVNISPLLLTSKSFGLRIVSILSELGFPPRRLEIEIMERALEMDFDRVRPFLENLRALGIRISIDDFGTGYSSLARLKSLPFDDLKIDRSFVQSMEDGEDRTLFVRTILQLGMGLGMTVTAEGIEEKDQRDSLIAEGCDLGQGYLYSAAIPSDQVASVLGGWTGKAAAGYVRASG